MPTSHLRRAAAAAATLGALASFSGPAAAQACYPPTPGCATTSIPVVIDDVVTATTRPKTNVVVRQPTSTRGGLARTGAVVVPTALIGIGLVAAGVALKRSSGRGKTTTTG